MYFDALREHGWSSEVSSGREYFLLRSSDIVVEESMDVNTTLLGEKLTTLRLPLGLDKGIV
jgi:hypothetical protein